MTYHQRRFIKRNGYTILMQMTIMDWCVVNPELVVIIIINSVVFSLQIIGVRILAYQRVEL